MITGGGELVRLYDFGSYKGVMLTGPESFGPLKYVYVLIVTESANDEPVLFVTSEKNEIQSALLSKAADKNPEIAAVINGNKCHIGVFHGGARSNYGGSLDWCVLEKFEKKALEITSQKLNIPIKPESTQSTHTPSANALTDSEGIIYPIKSFFLALLATASSIFVAIVGHVIFYLFDELRGIGDEWLQTIFRELLMPGVGGYFGIYVIHNYFENYSKEVVLWIYSVLLVSLYLSTWFFVLLYAQKAGIPDSDLVIHFLSIATAGIGIYLGKRTYW